MPFSPRWGLPRGRGGSQLWGAAPLSQREQIIRRIVQLNAEVHRLQQIGDESEVDLGEVEAYRSVRRLRVSMARDEMAAVRTELATLGRRLDQLDGVAAPTHRVDTGVEASPVAGSRSAALEAAELSALSDLQAVYRRDRASRGRMVALAVLVALAAAGVVLLDSFNAHAVGPVPRPPSGVRVIEPRVLSLKAYGPDTGIPEARLAVRALAVDLVESLDEWDAAEESSDE